ncbi:ABC transporter permease [Shinella zoogloeoides]|uniref:ABC transporter permease n=1 Tax=Shinella zoogloeoides TaxID=352475 RepID=UPI0028AFC572|nr:ABC transporter permease [Shinella zoogloeoides]
MSEKTMDRPVSDTSADERLIRGGIARSIVTRPGFGAAIGIVVVFAFFAVGSSAFASPAGISNWLDPASLIGLSAIPIALLMIGGEFDLSAGVMIASSSLVTAVFATEFGMNLWLAMLISLGFSALVGFLNGLLVVRTRLPSFIVTLGTFFVLQGLNQGVVKLITGTIRVDGLDAVPGYSSVYSVLASSFDVFGATIQVAEIWWVLATIVGSLVLTHSRWGNWIMSTGGDAIAARAMGVPVERVKITLFIAVSVMSWFVGSITAVILTSVTTSQGVGQELQFIVAAVVGGCLLTGGRGSVLGASAAALIFGMVQVGIPYRGWDSNFYFAFLGAVLFLAVFFDAGIRSHFQVRK